jgi:hypothetical protein
VPAVAEPLDQLIPNLFGGSLNTTVDQVPGSSSQQPAIIIRRFQDLGAELSIARSQVPIPSSSGAFSYAWDKELDTFVRNEQSLGSIFPISTSRSTRSTVIPSTTSARNSPPSPRSIWRPCRRTSARSSGAT